MGTDGHAAARRRDARLGRVKKSADALVEDDGGEGVAAEVKRHLAG